MSNDKRSLVEKQLGKDFVSFTPSPWDANGSPVGVGYTANKLEDVRAQMSQEPALLRQAALAGHGVKGDAHKPRFELLPPHALETVASVLAHGAAKYSDDNWRRVEGGYGRYIAAALRHVYARMKGERLDPESGMPHLAHAVCSVLFAMELDK